MPSFEHDCNQIIFLCKCVALKLFLLFVTKSFPVQKHCAARGPIPQAGHQDTVSMVGRQLNG